MVKKKGALIRKRLELRTKRGECKERARVRGANCGPRPHRRGACAELKKNNKALSDSSEEPEPGLDAKSTFPSGLEKEGGVYLNAPYQDRRKKRDHAQEKKINQRREGFLSRRKSGFGGHQTVKESGSERR